MLVPLNEALEVVRPLGIDDVLDEPDVFELLHIRGGAEHETLGGHVHRAAKIDHATVYDFAMPALLRQREHAETDDSFELIQLAQHALEHQPAARHAVLGDGQQVSQAASRAVVAHHELLHALRHAAPDARAEGHVAPVTSIAVWRRHAGTISHAAPPGAAANGLVAIGMGLDVDEVRDRLSSALTPVAGAAPAQGIRRLQRYRRLSI